MGKIILETFEIYGYHGCHLREQEKGNWFRVDVELVTDMEKPAQTDNLVDAVNYADVYKLVEKAMKERANLLECLTARIIDSIIHGFPAIEGVKVRVTKMNPPGMERLKSVSVEMERKVNLEVNKSAG